MSDLDTFDAVRGVARETVDENELREALERGIIVEDPRRRRPRYFDGRFLAARDLTRDQQYFLTRQADLGQLSGGGVVAGLEVTETGAGRSVQIQPGHGLTPSGELVVLRRAITVDLTDLPTSQRLDDAFRLSDRPRPPDRTRTGLFVLTLRPVEYAANPVASYPKTITGERRLEDGDIVEATAVTLIPLEDASGPGVLRRGRARLARQVFVERRPLALAKDGLPIAVVALERGTLAFIDPALARRDAGVDTALGFGLDARAAREAFIRQYEGQLASTVTERVAQGLSPRFAALDYFEALPPVGRLPPASVEVLGGEIVQWFFPPEIYAELSLVPDDEVPGLFEAGLNLPPIDLTLPAVALEAVPLLILTAVPRARFAELVARLQGVTTRALTSRLNRPLGRQRPIDGLQTLTLRRLQPSAPEPPPVDLAPWQDVLSEGPQLLFVRRRQLSPVAFVVPRYGPLPSDQQPSNTLSPGARDRLVAAGELDRFDRMMVTAGEEVLEALETTFSLALFDRPVLVNGVLAELAYRARRRMVLAETEGPAPAAPVVQPTAQLPTPLRLRPTTTEDVEAVASRYREGGLGTGFQALEAAEPGLGAFNVRVIIAQSLRTPELDARARSESGPEVGRLATRLLELAEAGEVEEIRNLIGVVVPPPSPGEPVEGSLASEVAVELDEGVSFQAVWTAADAALRERLEALLLEDLGRWPPPPPPAGTTPAARQRLAVTGVLMELIELGWGLQRDDPEATEAILLALRQWRPEDGAFLVPTLSTPEPPDGIRLSGGPALAILDDYGAFLRVPEGSTPATERLLSAGFPDEVELFRVIGLSGVARELGTWLLGATDDQVRRLVEGLPELSVVGLLEAASSRSQGNIRRILAAANEGLL